MTDQLTSRRAARAAGVRLTTRPSLRSRVAESGRLALKGSAGLLGVIGLAAALAVAPAVAAPTPASQVDSRPAVAAAPAVFGPMVQAPAAQIFGQTGYAATAKPKPKPKPKPQPKPPAEAAADALSVRTAGVTSRSAPRIRASGGCCLTASAQRILVQISWGFPQIQSIGGVRADSLPDHPSGRALDVMIPNPFSSDGIALGNSIVATMQAHASDWNIKYLIYRQRIWFPGSGWRTMSDRGGATANHMDHVHVTVNS